MMLKEKTFQIALFISILTHSAILYNLPHFDTNLKKSLQKIEINYQGLQIPKYSLTPVRKQEDFSKSNQQLDKIYIKKKSEVFPPQFSKGLLSRESKASQKKPNLANKLKFDKKVSLPPTETKINNPTYLNYYQIIREIIRKSAFRNFTKMHSGEVYLTFVITSSGTLEKVNLIEDKSVTDDYLRQVALKSLQESAPFPPFPLDLKYPQLSFNVIISFEIGD